MVDAEDFSEISLMIQFGKLLSSCMSQTFHILLQISRIVVVIIVLIAIILIFGELFCEIKHNRQKFDQ